MLKTLSKPAGEYADLLRREQREGKPLLEAQMWHNKERQAPMSAWSGQRARRTFTNAGGFAIGQRFCGRTGPLDAARLP